MTPIDEFWRTVEENGTLQTCRVATPDGAYQAYYAGVRDAILGSGANPVTAAQALMVMRLLDAGRASARQRREIMLDDILADEVA